MRAQGIEIRTLRELESDPERDRKLHALMCLLERDVPSADNLMQRLDGTRGFHRLSDAQQVKVRDALNTPGDEGRLLRARLDKALGERRGIRRFGDAVVPLDEALAQVAVDLGGRGWASIDLPFRGPTIGALSSEMIPHLLQSLATEGRFSLHVRLLAGENDHHRARRFASRASPGTQSMHHHEEFRPHL